MNELVGANEEGGGGGGYRRRIGKGVNEPLEQLLVMASRGGAREEGRRRFLLPLAAA